MATSTRRFGTGKRESHDASAFYARSLVAAEFSEDDQVADASEVDRIWCHSAEHMPELPDNSVALLVTSPGSHRRRQHRPDTPLSEHPGLLDRGLAQLDRAPR